MFSVPEAPSTDGEVAVPGQLHKGFLGHRRALGGALDVDQGALPDDRDLLSQRRLRQDDVEGDGLLELKRDAFALDGLEALQRVGDGVRARRQREEAVRADLVAYRGRSSNQPSAFCHDGNTGERSALIVLDRTDDLTGRGLCGGDADEERDREQGEQDLFHASVSLLFPKNPFGEAIPG
jgi:hypothetical protein